MSSYTCSCYNIIHIHNEFYMATGLGYFASPEHSSWPANMPPASETLNGYMVQPKLWIRECTTLRASASGKGLTGSHSQLL